MTETRAVRADETVVTRADIEAKLRAIQGEVGETGQSFKQYATAVAAVAVVAAVALAYGMGRRRGRRRSAVVEIVRV
jgi:hypothetical protein